jgi:hypothetical protein
MSWILESNFETFYGCSRDQDRVFHSFQTFKTFRSFKK